MPKNSIHAGKCRKIPLMQKNPLMQKISLMQKNSINAEKFH
jgi:hypothetical protein